MFFLYIKLELSVSLNVKLVLFETDWRYLF